MILPLIGACVVALLWRIYCELILVFFDMRDKLAEIAARPAHLALWPAQRDLDILNPRAREGPHERTRHSPGVRATIVGSLPKPGWLAEPGRTVPPWRLDGAVLDEGKEDAVRSGWQPRSRPVSTS